MKLTEKDIKLAADEIDRLVCAPIGSKFFRRTEYPLIHLLYEAARRKTATGDPLTYQAAKGLVDHVKPGDVVIFLTGWYLPMYMIGENDGPQVLRGLPGRSISGWAPLRSSFRNQGTSTLSRPRFRGLVSG